MKGCSKDIILPKIMVVDDGLDNCSAFYHKKDEEYIYIIEDLAVGLETGLIVIPNDASIGILAHEFRHHLQHQNQCKHIVQFHFKIYCVIKSIYNRIYNIKYG